MKITNPTVLAALLVLSTLSGPVARAAISGFECQGSLQEGELTGPVHLSVVFGGGPRGGDLTHLTSPYGEKSVTANYTVTASPHTRYGYGAHYDSELAGVSISAGFTGPFNYPDGASYEFIWAVAAVKLSEGKTVRLDCQIP